MDTMECCEKCFIEPALVKYIKANGHVKKSICAYCGRFDGKAIYLGDIESQFSDIVAEEYVRHEDLAGSRMINPLDGEYLSDLFQDDFEVFSDGAEEKKEELLDAILKSNLDMSDPPSHSMNDFYFRKNEDWGEFSLEEYSSDMWRTLKDAIKKHGHGLPLLVEREKVSDDVSHSYKEMLEHLSGVHKTLAKDKILYRARIGKHNTVEDLQAPPPEKVRASRCNLQGQPVLYLADSAKTAISEVRPAKFDVVTLGTFSAKKELKVCDFTLRETSPFQDFAKYKLERDWIKFSGILGKELGRPIRPSDEASAYLATQVLCGMIFKAGYDGIRYPSAQHDEGKNYVFFDVEAVKPAATGLQYVTVKNVDYECKDKLPFTS